MDAFPYVLCGLNSNWEGRCGPADWSVHVKRQYSTIQDQDISHQRDCLAHCHDIIMKLIALSAAGFAGHANYCVANAAVDSMAAAWTTQGHPAVALQWGAWASVGAPRITPFPTPSLSLPVLSTLIFMVLRY